MNSCAPLRRAGRRAVVFAASLASLVPLVGGCDKPDAKAQAGARPAGAPVPVTVATAEVGEIQRTVDVVGTLFGEEDATISNKVNGKVVAIYKDVGDRVRPGEPLAQLLRNDYLLDVNLKQSALYEVLAKLKLKQPPTRDYDVQQLPSVVQARRGFENAERKFKVGQELFQTQPRPLISPQEFEDLQSARDVAQSAYDAAVLDAKGMAGNARTRDAELRQALQALADTTIRAPLESYPTPDVEIELPASSQDEALQAAAPLT